MPEHKSVLLHECIENLNIKPDGIYVDGTLGLGGHSMEIAKRLTTGRLIAIDQDETAIERSKARLAPWAERITFVHGNFRSLGKILDDLGIDRVNGMLFDLGVSSPQPASSVSMSSIIAAIRFFMALSFRSKRICIRYLPRAAPRFGSQCASRRSRRGFQNSCLTADSSLFL